jgi:membrane protein
MVLGVAFLLLVSMLLSAALAALGDLAGALLSVPPIVLQTINFSMSFAVITALFAAIFKVLPDANVRWRDVWVGAVFTSLLFTVGKFVLGLYLGREETASTYGAAGAFVVILLWVYYSAVILLLGAEFTQVWARFHGSAIAPADGAVRLSDTDRARQGIANDNAVEAEERKETG